MISTMQNKKLKKWATTFVVAAIWIGIWQLLYMIVKKEILIVSPLHVLNRLIELVQEKSFWLSTAASMLRVLIAFAAGLVVGTILAVLTHKFAFLHALFYPILAIIRATPVASFIILALVWLKSNELPIFMAFLMVLPAVWTNVTEGIEQTDIKLLEMAKVYRFSRWKTIRLVYIPSIMPYFLAAFATGLGLCWKANIAAEVLAIPKLAIGTMLYDAKVYLLTADLFAWTAVVILLSMVLEKILVLGVKKIGKRYQLGT